MDNVSSYSLCFEGCIEQANQTEPRKIAITIVNVDKHDIGKTSIYISFTDAISCQMARDILGDKDWELISDIELHGALVDGVGYKIQNHYFKNLFAHLSLG
ncbi:hypothetical protein MTZ49_10595 [Entomomonas sp. E2T0]|uniref:hypothetical protein n=1 Tax=Entomomonas sp. E2T0 TaxID=2930213 RepID=UPI0022280ED7|nr:hypothetical protein [Entomomonas sp. E2T0]UYZ83050.1 hypothetical protein MTZ49_10595 [Entomomonas sp. E2T0]